jgi:hypothetical protein
VKRAALGVVASAVAGLAAVGPVGVIALGVVACAAIGLVYWAIDDAGRSVRLRGLIESLRSPKERPALLHDQAKGEAD